MKTTRILLVLVLFCIPHFLMSQNNLLYETIEKAKLSGSNFKKINSVFSYDNINFKQSDISDKFLNAEDIYYLKYDNSTVKKMENTISILCVRFAQGHLLYTRDKKRRNLYAETD